MDSLTDLIGKLAVDELQCAMCPKMCLAVWCNEDYLTVIILNVFYRKHIWFWEFLWKYVIYKFIVKCHRPSSEYLIRWAFLLNLVSFFSECTSGYNNPQLTEHWSLKKKIKTLCKICRSHLGGRCTVFSSKALFPNLHFFPLFPLQQRLKLSCLVNNRRDLK